MKKIIDIIVENDGYLINKADEEGAYVRVIPQGIQRIPCIPFYHSAWISMGSVIRPAIQDFVEKATVLHGPIAKCQAMIATPADALPADVTMIRETFEVAGIKKIKLISKTSLGAAMNMSDYVAVSASERLLIVEWYRDGVVAEGKYYNKAAISKKKLLSDINGFRQRYEVPLKIIIFDGCNELSGLYDLGEVVDARKMMTLLEVMNEVYFKGKSFQELFANEEGQDAWEPDEIFRNEQGEMVFGEEELQNENATDATEQTPDVDDYSEEE